MWWKGHGLQSQTRSVSAYNLWGREQTTYLSGPERPPWSLQGCYED